MIRNFLFSFSFFSGIIFISIIFLPSLLLPQKITLFGGKLMGYWSQYCLKIILSTKIVIKGKDNIINDEKQRLRNEKLQRRINLITKETEIQSKITNAVNVGDEQTARRLQFELEKVRIQTQLGEDLRNAKSVEEEILLVKKAIAQTDAVRLRINSQLTQQEIKLKSLYESIGRSIENGLVSAIQGAIDGTKTLGDVARSVFSEISSSLIRFGVNAFLGSLFPGSSFFRANGGTVSRGKSYIVGERGAEMFVPNAGGRIVPNSDMGGSTNVVVNVDASGSNVQGDQQRGKELGAALSVAIQSELLKQKRPGGLLA